MPNRIIRDGILTSDRVNKLSANAELFYRRLMSVVDDFGRFSANLTLLRASCYPLKLDCVKEDSIKRHLAECEAAGLVVLYTVATKGEFLEMRDFKQQIRAQTSKYPKPPKTPQGELPIECSAGDKQTPANAHLGGVVSVVEDEVDILRYLNAKTGRDYQEVDANLHPIQCRIKEVKCDLAGIKVMIDRQVALWKGTDQEQYLRPETLFGKTKFHGYYGSREIPVRPAGSGPSTIPLWKRIELKEKAIATDPANQDYVGSVAHPTPEQKAHLKKLRAELAELEAQQKREAQGGGE